MHAFHEPPGSWLLRHDEIGPQGVRVSDLLARQLVEHDELVLAEVQQVERRLADASGQLHWADDP